MRFFNSRGCESFIPSWRADIEKASNTRMATLALSWRVSCSFSKLKFMRKSRSMNFCRVCKIPLSEIDCAELFTVRQTSWTAHSFTSLRAVSLFDEDTHQLRMRVARPGKRKNPSHRSWFCLYCGSNTNSQKSPTVRLWLSSFLSIDSYTLILASCASFSLVTRRAARVSARCRCPAFLFFF